MIFQVVSVLIFIGYALLISAITIGWWRLRVFKKTDLLPEVKVSVIVAVRNEAMYIHNLLSSLLKQDYPKYLLEIIIVDDHSTDSTSRLIDDFFIQDGRILFQG